MLCLQLVVWGSQGLSEKERSNIIVLITSLTQDPNDGPETPSQMRGNTTRGLEKRLFHLLSLQHALCLNRFSCLLILITACSLSKDRN